ncbi:MAG TPA: phosphate signaling complex protein PhoU [Firmicutes bacterium]|nr:phosphate signaling complex protein PhoU [Candidatus Fermentithermobacillaceae bacterium]
MLRFNAYDRGLQNLKQGLIKMGGTVQSRFADAMAALILQDAEKAQAIVESDDVVNDMDYALEDQALGLILLQQPREQDLRVLSSTLRLTKELERIGDYAVNIAVAALALCDCGDYFKPLCDIRKMGEEAANMLHGVLQAYLKSDIDLAMSVAERDDVVDALFESLFNELLGHMQKGPCYVVQASHLSLVARHLERISDHAVNIAEMVFYIETGERRSFRDLKHTGANGITKEAQAKEIGVICCEESRQEQK